MKHTIVAIFVNSILIPILFFNIGGSVLYYVLIVGIGWGSAYFVWKNTKLCKKSIVWLYLINFIVLNLLIIYGVLFYESYIEYKLEQFDLDGDTFFSKEEQTPEQQKYMNMWVNDLGRNIMLVIGFFCSIASTLLMIVFVSIALFLKKKQKQV